MGLDFHPRSLSSLTPPGRRCARHELAAGPDGQCALCRSESLPPRRAYSTWVLSGILLAILLVSAAAVAYRTVTSLAQAAIAREPAARGAVPHEERVGTAPTVPSPLADAHADDSSPAAAESIPLVEALPEPAVVTEPEPAAPLAAALPAPSKPSPTQAELRAALSATPIVMYSASWCGVCRKAKQFLSENGLRYREIDADTTPGAWEKIERLIGRRGVPVIIVDGELTPAGLSPPGIMRAVSNSLERRLGVRGIRFTSN